MSIQVAIAPGDRVVPWINQCPPEWPLKPLKYATKINSRALGENTASDFEINYIDISSVDSNGRPNPAETMTFADAPSRARRIVASGDVIISTVRTYLKAISYIENANDKLICSTGFAVITPGPQVHPKFLFHWVRSEWFVTEIVARSVGVSYPAINAIEVGSLPFPAIPLEEQKAIAEFLDKETARIDELIAKKQKLIELLHEQRTALITHTVTKGLNPDASMKDSEVEWLGEIPAHWSTNRIKFTTYVKGRIGWHGLRSDEFCDEGPFLVTGTDFVDGQIEWNKCYHISEERYLEDHHIHLREGDLLITKDGSIGKIALVRNMPYKTSLNSGIFLTRPLNESYITGFMYWVLQSMVFTEYIGYVESGSTIQHLYQETFENFVFPMPPREEQQGITDFLNKETSRIDNLVSKINQAIDKLQEYRSAFIAAAVTGKIDVRRPGP